MNACCSLRWLNGFGTLTLSVFVLVWKHLFSGSPADTFLQLSAYITCQYFLWTGTWVASTNISIRIPDIIPYKFSSSSLRNTNNKNFGFWAANYKQHSSKKKNNLFFFILSTHCNIKNIPSQLIKKQTTLFFTEWGKTKHFISY